MSKQFKILIVDDESLARDSIRILLESRSECVIVGEADNGKDALSKIKAHQPDIVFLDIQMPKLQGFEVIKLLGTEHLPVFVMVTAFDQHALEAFDLNAIDYLLKPYSNERFYKSLEKAIQLVKHDESHQELGKLKSLLIDFNSESKSYKLNLAIKSAGKIELVNKNDIIFIKASGNYCEIHTASKKHLMYTSITQLEDQLDPQIFVRIHRSSIVKKDCIQKLESHFNGEYLIFLNNGVELKLSRTYRDNLNAILS